MQDNPQSSAEFCKVAIYTLFKKSNSYRFARTVGPWLFGYFSYNTARLRATSQKDKHANLVASGFFVNLINHFISWHSLPTLLKTVKPFGKI